MIVCDEAYHEALMRLIKELRAKHPDWTGSRVLARAKIEVCKL